MFEKLKEWIKGMKTKDRRNPIEKRIDELCVRMGHYDEISDEYKEMANILQTLTEANSKLKEQNCKKSLDSNVIFNGVVAFAQIVVILLWEERHILRSNATKFITKLIGHK